jgi:hypothetical protein
MSRCGRTRADGERTQSTRSGCSTRYRTDVRFAQSIDGLHFGQEEAEQVRNSLFQMFSDHLDTRCMVSDLVVTMHLCARRQSGTEVLKSRQVD